MKALSADTQSRLLELIQASTSIHSHLEYFIWLQVHVRSLLPHDVLMASWGNFANGEIRFDIVSALPGIRTGQFSDRPDLNAFAQYTYKRWESMGRNPYVEIPGNHKSMIGHPASCLFPVKPHSYLVSGLQCKRSKCEAIYTFINFHDPHAEVARSLSLLIVPHIDSTLRRLDMLPTSDPGAEPHPQPIEFIPIHIKFGLSEREYQIMSWIQIGKTNTEVGLILGITENTVKNHLKRIFSKLNVSKRAQAVAKLSAPS